MVKSFQKSGLLMLAILGAILMVGALAFFHPLTQGPSPSGLTAGRAVEYEASWADSATDRFGDGTPDFLRLDSPEDPDAFRRRFAVIAEYQALPPDKALPPATTAAPPLLPHPYSTP